MYPRIARQLLLLPILSFVVLGGIVLSPFSPNQAGAQACDGNRSVLGIPTWSRYLDHEESSGACRPVIRSSGTLNPDADPEEVEQDFNNFMLIGIAVIEIFVTLAGLVAVVMIFIGAFRYLISTGSPDKTSSAQKTVINALVGLVIVIVGTRITSFIASALQ